MVERQISEKSLGSVCSSKNNSEGETQDPHSNLVTPIQSDLKLRARAARVRAVFPFSSGVVMTLVW